LKEGRPTGIKREDLSGPKGPIYQGERATVVSFSESGSEVVLWLGFGDRNIELFGYFAGDEFIELDSQFY